MKTVSRATVAVIVQNRPFMGAVLMHAPLLSALRAGFPQARLVVLSQHRGAGLLVRPGFADELVVYGEEGVGLTAALQSLQPTVVLSLRRKSVRVGAAVARSGADVRIGYAYRFMRAFYTHTVSKNAGDYRARSHLNLLGPLNLDTSDRFAATFHALMNGLMNGVHVERRRHAPVVLIPAGSDPRKQWGAENYLSFCRSWKESDPDAAFAVVGGPEERNLVSTFRASELADSLTFHIECSLTEVCTLIANAPLVVANDCGPGHLAHFSGRPMVSLFGNWDGRADRRVADWYLRRPTSRCLTGPVGHGASAIPVHRVVDATRDVAARPLFTL